MPKLKTSRTVSLIVTMKVPIIQRISNLASRVRAALDKPGAGVPNVGPVRVKPIKEG